MKVCLLCGNSDNLTIHHLKSQTRKSRFRKQLGIILCNGECVVLCRECHDLIEYIKSMRFNDRMKTLKSQFKNSEFYSGGAVKQMIDNSFRKVKVKT